MLKNNGYVLEQLYSPLIIQTTPGHTELKEIAKGCFTSLHSHHYLGFAETQRKLFEKEDPRRVKPLLYMYRVLLSGIYLMQMGEVEANLLRLNEYFRLPQIEDLVSLKLSGAEKSTLSDIDLDFHESEYRRLRAALEEASETSDLPKLPTAKPALHDLAIRLRALG